MIPSTKIYFAWNDMKTRCYNKDRDSWPFYGAKGITICDEWLDFALPDCRRALDALSRHALIAGYFKAFQEAHESLTTASGISGSRLKVATRYLQPRNPACQTEPAEPVYLASQDWQDVISTLSFSPGMRYIGA